MNQLRWGILGAARIARKNWKAIRRSGNGLVAAVASRDRDRARQFIVDCQQLEPFAPEPAALGSYEELVSSSDIDAVYIPLPTGLRKEWVIRAAHAGKHVLCEKPCAVTAADLDEMVAACRANRVQFMDGVMFMHNPRLGQLQAVLKDGNSLGEIHRIVSHFSFLGSGDFFSQNIRVNAALEPLGSLGDLGWYCVRFSLWAMNWQNPLHVSGRILRASSGVPTAFSGELVWDGGVSASFYCSFIEQHQQWASLSGVKGYLHVPDFVLPLYGNEVAFELNTVASRMVGCDYVNERSVRRVLNPPGGLAQEACMFRNFADQVRSGQLNEDWMRAAQLTQQVTNECLAAARCG